MKLKNNKRQLPFPVLCLEESVFRNALFEYNFRKSKNKKTPVLTSSCPL